MKLLVKIIFFLLLANNMPKICAVLLTKAFYHRGQCVDKLVFYFDQKINLSQHRYAGQVVYELQNIQIDPAVQQALAQIPALAKTYGISFKTSKQDLSVLIKFDKQQVIQISAAKFKPISQAAGLVIQISHINPQAQHACVRPAAAREIVLDFGHGGSDTGAKFGTIMEKDIVRSVGLKLSDLLIKKGWTVHLTRLEDEFVPLDERTSWANLQTNASLFVSLHANHAPNKQIRGLETYYMPTSLLHWLDQGMLLNADKSNYQDQASASLASLVHHNIIQAAHKTRYKLADRQVKQAVSQVLLGVEMPAILVELGFLSNQAEAQQLNLPEYQKSLAQAICNGLMAYAAAH